MVEKVGIYRGMWKKNGLEFETTKLMREAKSKKFLTVGPQLGGISN